MSSLLKTSNKTTQEKVKFLYQFSLWKKCIFIFLRIYLFIIYLFNLSLVALCLSCSTRDLRWGVQDLLLRCVGSSLWHMGFSLVVVWGFSLLSSCGVQDLSLRHVGSSLWHMGFSLVAVWGFSLLSSCGMQAPGHVWVPERVGSVVCGTWALVEARELSSVARGLNCPMAHRILVPRPGV